MTSLLKAPASQPQSSTGLPKVKLLQFKTKDNAVPAGLSPLPELLVPLLLSRIIVLQLITPSNKSLIAIQPDKVAPVVLWTWPSPTSRPILLSSLLTIHTKLPMELAHTMPLKEQVKSPVTRTFQSRCKRKRIRK